MHTRYILERTVNDFNIEGRPPYNNTINNKWVITINMIIITHK